MVLEFKADGSLASACVGRWANPNGRPWGEYPCGGTVEEEAVFGGARTVSSFRAGYFFGTDQWQEGELFRARVTGAQFI